MVTCKTVLVVAALLVAMWGAASDARFIEGFEAVIRNCADLQYALTHWGEDVYDDVNGVQINHAAMVRGCLPPGVEHFDFPSLERSPRSVNASQLEPYVDARCCADFRQELTRVPFFHTCDATAENDHDDDSDLALAHLFTRARNRFRHLIQHLVLTKNATPLLQEFDALYARCVIDKFENLQ